jgi:hypothetical protein
MVKMDHAGRCAVANEIANRSPYEAEEVAKTLENTDPLLAAEIKKAIERRNARPQPPHKTFRASAGRAERT